MLIGDNNISTNLKIPISYYCNNLIFMLENYFNIINNSSILDINDEINKAKITLRYVIFPNEKEFKIDYEKIKLGIGSVTQYLISNYSRCIMKLVGQIAECLIVDRCTNDKEINIKLINMALYRPNIYEKYEDIDYDLYIPISPSFKFILIKENGIIKKYNITQYNPDDTNVDIAWAKKENLLSQLKLNIPKIEYFENAKLQIKASINQNNLYLNNKYFFTPILYFDLCNDADKLKLRYPEKHIVSAKDISLELHTEMVNYFKILAAYITGISKSIDIDDFDVTNNEKLSYIMNSPIQNLFESYNNNQIIDLAIEEVQKYSKPVIINT